MPGTNKEKIQAMKNYKEAVLHMLRCTSVVSNATFMDSVNAVLKTRKELIPYNVSVEEAMK